ncbi:MAG: hypothetical protein VX481_02980 [Cyanobacteriota bacterium]|nr:hypothetical protein [Cyanobacteriota bacterium]
MSALISCLRATLPMPHPAVIVPIPSWKRRQVTPLPGLIEQPWARSEPICCSAPGPAQASTT